MVSAELNRRTASSFPSLRTMLDDALHPWRATASHGL